MSSEPEDPPVDLSRLARTTGGDVEVELELLRIFLEQTEERLRSVEAALARRDYAQIREDAHSIKGASANVGADRLRELAATLEGRMKSGEHEQVEAMVNEVTVELARVRAYLERDGSSGQSGSTPRK
jgi:HPt (histidine-containing phosphotransfer) domain-containing protein